MANSAHLFIYFTINGIFSSEITIVMVFCSQLVNTELHIIFKFSMVTMVCYHLYFRKRYLLRMLL